MRRLAPFFAAFLLFASVPNLAADPPKPMVFYNEKIIFKPIILDNRSTRSDYDRIKVAVPEPALKFVEKKKPERLTPDSTFVYDNEVSWYGPGFYGNRTACGLAYTTSIMGVAHRTLPCGTLVDFRFKGKTIRVPVIDRGPYVAEREWDLSGGLCVALDHCFTGPIEYRIIK